MTQHSAGPWALGTGYYTGENYAVCSGPEIIATVNGKGYPIGKGRHPVSDANAALIATAPEMLTALEDALWWLENFSDREPGEGISDAIAETRATIAKARGKSYQTR